MEEVIFLRAFVDWMVAQMNEKIGFDAGIVIVKPTPSGHYDDLIQQEGLFNVQTSGIQDGKIVDDLYLVKSVCRVVQPYQDFQSYLALAEQPNLNIIISNTTEAGIVFEAETQLENHPVNSFPGKLTQLLYRRYQVFPTEGFVILPCELIEKNGGTLQQCVLQYAQLWGLGSDFEDWVMQHNSFCNTLVDRIVPGFPAERAATIFQQIGVQDNLLVAAEPYHLWVIEGDKRAQQYFPVHQIGLNVHFTNDLMPFRTIKVRVLNGAHTAMTMFGYLHGCRTVRACMEHPTVNAFVQSLVFDEILPTLPYEEAEKYSTHKLL
ncbi:MAG: tagaturonate reductase [Saprospiraceae bacterium]|nr:tagaturonate reductase [Saprospiraceae bacterium]